MDHFLAIANQLSSVSLSEGLIIIVVFSLAVAVLQLTLRAIIGKSTIIKCHEVGGHIFAAVGTLYAVVLGLYVLDAQSLYEKRLEGIVSESTALMALYENAHAMPKEGAERLETSLKNYVGRVVNFEWNSLANAARDEGARQELLNASRILRELNPTTNKQLVLYDKMNDQIYDAWKERSQRIYQSEASKPRLEWGVLMIGACITLALGVFFRMDSLALQATVDILLAVIVSINLFLVAQFRNPYAGEINLTKEPFVRVLKIMNQTP